MLTKTRISLVMLLVLPILMLMGYSAVGMDEEPSPEVEETATATPLPVVETTLPEENVVSAAASEPEAFNNEIMNRSVASAISKHLHEDILKVQERLKELNYGVSDVDGVKGNETTRAINLFQEVNDLEKTGEISKELKDVLFAEDAATYVPPAPPTPTYTPGSNKDIAISMLGNYGFGMDQWSCLETLWTRESNWNHLARNKSSGAYGIPQSLPGNKMAASGPDWQTNPVTQIDWGLNYIKGRYGTPCAALNHSYAKGFY